MSASGTNAVMHFVSYPRNHLPLPAEHEVLFICSKTGKVQQFVGFIVPYYVIHRVSVKTIFCSCYSGSYVLEKWTLIKMYRFISVTSVFLIEIVQDQHFSLLRVLISTPFFIFS